MVFISRISRNLRARDATLADLRQRAAEEEHIVRMGLLASGAAHELGTPLATLSVILGDWAPHARLRRRPRTAARRSARCRPSCSAASPSSAASCCRPARRAANRRCETTISLPRRPGGGVARDARRCTAFAYENQFGHDMPMVSDSALKQMIDNVLDNALEASPDWVRLDARPSDGDALMLTRHRRRPRLRAGMLAAVRQALPVEQGAAGRRPGPVPGRQRGAHAGRRRSRRATGPKAAPR